MVWYSRQFRQAHDSMLVHVALQGELELGVVEVDGFHRPAVLMEM